MTGKIIVIGTFISLIIASGCSFTRRPDRYIETMDRYLSQSRAQREALIPKPVAPNGSIFAQLSGEGGRYTTGGVGLGSIFSDFKARDINDIVTIQVVESTKTSITSNGSSERKSDSEAGLTNFLGLGGPILGALPNLNPAKLTSGSGSQTFDGAGSVERNSAFTTVLSARVVEVLPNGNLVIEAIREVWVNSERQTLLLSGVIRPKDVSTDNVVLSTAIANMQVRLNGKGLATSSSNPGFLFKLLQKISPF